MALRFRDTTNDLHRMQHTMHNNHTQMGNYATPDLIPFVTLVAYSIII